MAVLVCILVLLLPLITNAAFIESPMSQNVSIGQEAVFRCEHPTADIIRWRINGSLVSRSSLPEGVGLDADGLVEILTITGRLDYNGTVVQCVARFDSGSPDEVSNPALLIVAADASPTDSTGEGFITSPLSVNVAVGTETMFHCEHLNADSLSWFINGTTRRSQPDLHDTFIEGTSGLVRFLTVTALSQYNSTRIECVAFFSNDQPSERTPPALLLMQVPLDAVNILTKVTTTIISWEQPFSLDLTSVDPDIVYCVDVYNITCGGRDLVNSDCSVTDTNYTSLLCDGYLCEYIVTPRSNVEGAQNGTESHLTDALPKFFMSSTQLSRASSDSLGYQIGLYYTPAVPIPSSYTLSLEALDGLSDLDHVDITATEKQPNLMLTVTGLESQRLWNCTIIAYKCEENGILSGEILSTHDFQGVNVTSPSPGQVSVDGFFIENSTASGVLVIATDGSNTSYHFIDRDSDRLNGDTKLMGLPGGECIVSVFVMKEDGLAVKRAAALPRNLNVINDNGTNTSSSIDYKLQSNSTGVCITCTFLESSTATDCVAVVHQQISQLNSSAGLMNIDSRKFTRSGDTASGCIEGVNLEDYQVGAIEWRQLQSGSPAAPTKTTSISGIIGVGVAIVVSLAVVVIVLVVIVIRKWKSPKSPTKDGPAPPNIYFDPAPLTNNPNDPLVNSVPSDGGNYDTVINMVSGPPPPPHTAGAPPPPPHTAAGPPPPPHTAGAPPPQYSTLFHPGTTRPTDVGAKDRVNEAMYSTLAEASDTVNVPVAADEQGNHSDIKHEEINGDQYAVVNKSKKESKSSGDAEGDKKPLVYSTLAAVDPSVRVPPTTDDPVAYSTVQHKKGENGDQSVAIGKQESGGDGSVGETVKESKGTVIYSTPELKRHKVSVPLDDDRVEYAKVKGTNGQTVSPNTEDHAPPPLPTRFTVDNLLLLLRPITSKWREMSEYMSLNEELIDEIDTNNETDEPCLQVALGWYMKNGDKKHEWEEIVAILKRMGEQQLADKVYDLHVRPYIVPLPGETQPTEGRQRQHSGSSSDSGIGNSDSGSHSSTPPSTSDDEESVHLSGTASDPEISSPIQQQTTDLGQGIIVHVHQTSDGSTHVRPTRTYGEASLTFLGDKQVVGTVSDPTRTGDQVVCQADAGLAPVVSHFQSNVATSRSHESAPEETVEPQVPSEPEQTDYMEMLSACSSSSLDLSHSERIRLLRHRRTSNHESDELWQTQAKAYSTLSEGGNSEDQEDFTADQYEDSEDNVTKHAVIYVAFFKLKLKVTIQK